MKYGSGSVPDAVGQVATLWSFDILLEERRRGGTSFSVLATEERGQLVDLVLARQVLCEQVRWDDLPSDLSHRNRTSPVLFLQPKGVSLEVPQLPET